MLPLPFHHALQHHGCSVPFVHHHPHCKLFTFDFWSRKRVTVRLGWRNVAMSNIYIFIELPLFVDYILNPSKSTFVICSNQLFFWQRPRLCDCNFHMQMQNHTLNDSIWWLNYHFDG
jgi:hypothetical protein